MQRLVLRPEFGSGPLWEDEWDGGSEICPDPASFGISVELATELANWQAEYDATLDHSYPPNRTLRARPWLQSGNAGDRSSPTGSVWSLVSRSSLGWSCPEGATPLTMTDESPTIRRAAAQFDCPACRTMVQDRPCFSTGTKPVDSYRPRAGLFSTTLRLMARYP
jgi:hypothetical protein